MGRKMAYSYREHGIGKPKKRPKGWETGAFGLFFAHEDAKEYEEVGESSDNTNSDNVLVNNINELLKYVKSTRNYRNYTTSLQLRRSRLRRSTTLQLQKVRLIVQQFLKVCHP